jgi:protein AATF/BFR2
VSREALQADDSDDDPFRRRSSDEEEDEDDVEGLEEEDLEADETGDEEEEEEEEPQRRSKTLRRTHDDVSVDGMETGDSEEDEDIDRASDEESDDFGDEDELSDDASESDEDEPNGVPVSDEREELRRLMATDQKTVAATISEAAKADATKGFAVKQQRLTFDALLNTRIKLQKGLIAVNELPTSLEDADAVDEDAIKSAESAALALWSTLEELRLTLADVQFKDPSKKRKRPPPVSPATSSESLWKRMAELEKEAMSHRRAVLDRWSSKVRGSSATLANARGKLFGEKGSGQQTITAVLDAHIASETGERAAKRTRVNSTANSDAPNEPIYDDTVFYQSLLRDLVEQRMSSSEALTNGIDSLHVQLPTNPAGMRKDKVRKAVDTKASKGRKMRYNVHEKLQNFMAPEDRGTWTSHAREEFFASLLGRTASGLLGEGDEEADGVGAQSDEDVEEGGLKLFRS